MREDDGSRAHRQYENMAVAHVLGGLDSDQGRIFRSHLLECPVCRARVGELRAIASDLAGVERDERRERSAKAVETKRREEAQTEEHAEPARTRVPPRWLLFALATTVILLAAYTLVLRGNVQRLDEAYELRLLESSALEHGEDLEVRFVAPEVVGTAKVHRGRIVVLLEGLEDDTSYGFYLYDDDGSAPEVIDSGPLQAQQGRVLRLLDAPASADRLVLTAPEGSWATEADGRRLLEVLVHEPAEQPDSIGSA